MQNKIDIEEILEKIVFDKDNLDDLKKVLMEARSGKISIKDLGKTIIKLRAHILEALKEFIPFHLKRESTSKSLAEFTQRSPNSPQLENELEEKNQLLETIGLRINKIYETLNNDLEGTE